MGLSAVPRGQRCLFDAAFARLEYLARNRFNLSCYRHTGQWWTVHRGVTLAEALGSLETEGISHPH